MRPPGRPPAQLAPEMPLRGCCNCWVRWPSACRRGAGGAALLHLPRRRRHQVRQGLQPEQQGAVLHRSRGGPARFCLSVALLDCHLCLHTSLSAALTCWWASRKRSSTPCLMHLAHRTPVAIPTQRHWCAGIAQAPSNSLPNAPRHHALFCNPHCLQRHWCACGHRPGALQLPGPHDGPRTQVHMGALWGACLLPLFGTAWRLACLFPAVWAA